MLHKNVIENKGGFRTLSDAELEAVSGGENVIIVDGFRERPAEPAPFIPSSFFSSSGGESSGGKSILDRLLDFVLGDPEAEAQEKRDKQKADEKALELAMQDRELQRSAINQFSRDCLASGGNPEITQKFEGSSGDARINAEGNFRGLPISGGLQGGGSSSSVVVTMSCNGRQ